MSRLLETYAKRINYAKNVYAQSHINEAYSRTKQLTLACVLNNSNKFLTERFNNSQGTQASDIKTAKKFVMNLTNLVMPTLLADRVVLVNPINSRAGFVTYMDYVAGSNKGGVKQGDIFNSGLTGLGNMTEDRIQYTAAPISEEALADGATNWKPVDGKVEKFEGLDSEGKAIWVEIEVKDIVKGDKIRYHYDNEYIPAYDIPTINAVQREIPLLAHERRVQIYWSQIAEYDLKQQTGEDLSKMLPEEAVGELKYEIDCEVVMFLKKLAGGALAELVFNKHVPVGLSKPQHYEGFLETVEAAATVVYNRTKRYSPNYMICARDVIQVLTFCSGYKSANAKAINGPYIAGNLNGVEVIVSPQFEKGEFIMGVNEGKVSAAVWAPYMAIVPTMLIGRSDGSLNQGFSSMYALEALNPQLVIAGKVVDEVADGAVLVANA